MFSSAWVKPVSLFLALYGASVATNWAVGGSLALAVAASVGSSASKFVAAYLHSKAWEKLGDGFAAGVKPLTLFSLLYALSVASNFLTCGSLLVALGVAVFSSFSKSLVAYVHDKVWMLAEAKLAVA